MKKPSAQQHNVTVSLGEAATVIGRLSYTKDGGREYSTFAYDAAWLESPDRFTVSADLELTANAQYRKAPSKDDSVFHFGIADTEPDGWGCRVIARDHAKRRKAELATGQAVQSPALTEFDYLMGVDDFSRIGALRLQDAQGNFLRTIESGNRATPPLLELAHLLGASRAVEMGTETAEDLRYLRGRGTSVGGMRPKCTVVDDDGHLAIGKFPSVKDVRSVTKGEVLALRLAAAAGINAAAARLVYSDSVPVAIIRRFDRTLRGERIPYLSAASMLQAFRQQDYAYTEIAERIIGTCVDPKADLAQLWRRIIFNLLITNVDDHLQNHGFLHVGHGQWRLAPAFDINPFPDKDRELKTWLTEAGPTDSIAEVVQEAAAFWLQPVQALEILTEVFGAVRAWKTVARTEAVGMTDQDIDDFSPAFEHEQTKVAAALLGL